MYDRLSQDQIQINYITINYKINILLQTFYQLKPVEEYTPSAILNF